MLFAVSDPLTFGLELEFQIVDPATGLLAPAAPALYRTFEGTAHAKAFALEATQATIEFNSSIHRSPAEMAQEVMQKVGLLKQAAATQQLDIRGGGTHMAQFWNERVMTPSERAAELRARFGFLPKRFSTYGMHVHIGMPDADSAIRVANVLQALGPLFIAMSAASPFLQNTDSGFAASRPLEPLLYPSGGPMPYMEDWAQFEVVAQEFFDTELAHNLKDIYWDVRPKPEFGTVEVRVFDTPLSVHKAVELAAWTRALAAAALERHLVLQAPMTGSALLTAMRVSRFMACRDGMAGTLYDPFKGGWTDGWRLMADMEQLLMALPAEVLKDGPHIASLCDRIRRREDHTWMREQWQQATNHPHTEAPSSLARYTDVLCGALLG